MGYPFSEHADSAQPRIPTFIPDPLSRGAREGSGNETTDSPSAYQVKGHTLKIGVRAEEEEPGNKATRASSNKRVYPHVHVRK